MLNILILSNHVVLQNQHNFLLFFQCFLRDIFLGLKKDYQALLYMFFLCIFFFHFCLMFNFLSLLLLQVISMFQEKIYNVLDSLFSSSLSSQLNYFFLIFSKYQHINLLFKTVIILKQNQQLFLNHAMLYPNPLTIYDLLFH